MIAMSVVLIILYFGNSTIRYIYNLNDCGEYVKFYAARNVVYEIMLFLFCMIGFYNTRGLTKAFLCFLGVMIFGSIIDKGLFKITYYIYTDIVIGVIAICISIIIYNHDRRVERN